MAKLNEILVSGYDLSGGAANWTSSSLVEYSTYYVRFIWSNVTGTLDGSLLVRDTTDQVLFESRNTEIIDSANETREVNNVNVKQPRLNVSFVPNGVTGGKLTVELTAKENKLQAHNTRETAHESMRNDLRVKKLTLTPSSVQNITAAGGITPTCSTMRIQGSGGAVDITANPQIAAGVAGQLLLLDGTDDTNTVQIDNGNGVHLHGGVLIIGNHDNLLLKYDADNAEWEEISRSADNKIASWAFSSPTGGGATFYIGGHYEFGSTDNDFNPSITFGTANKSEAAHFFIVQTTGAGTDTVIRVSGTTITDAGVRATSQTEDLTIASGSVANTYHETSKKWLGQVTVAKQSGTDVLCNYGFTKYWDNNNTDFRLVGLEATWLAGANDNDVAIKLRHHKTTGWTYNAGAAPTPPTELASLATDHSTDDKTVSGENGAWKRDNLTTTIMGGDAEGILIELITTAAKTFQIGNLFVEIRPN